MNYENWQLPQLFEALVNSPQWDNLQNTFGSVTDENLFGGKDKELDFGWHNQLSQGQGPQVSLGYLDQDKPQPQFETYFV